MAGVLGVEGVLGDAGESGGPIRDGSLVQGQCKAVRRVISRLLLKDTYL